MANNEDLFKQIIAHAKEYGFIFPSSEIYDGLAAVYDYGERVFDCITAELERVGK